MYEGIKSEGKASLRINKIYDPCWGVRPNSLNFSHSIAVADQALPPLKCSLLNRLTTYTPSLPDFSLGGNQHWMSLCSVDPLKFPRTVDVAAGSCVGIESGGMYVMKTLGLATNFGEISSVLCDNKARKREYH